MDLKVGYVCDRGLSPKRPVNQDRFLVIPKRGLFAVFDGVGGQRAGEVASQTAAETIEEASQRERSKLDYKNVRSNLTPAQKDSLNQDPIPFEQRQFVKEFIESLQK